MRFFVDGLPVAQARPRFARSGNHGGVYASKKESI